GGRKPPGWRRGDFDSVRQSRQVAVVTVPQEPGGEPLKRPPVPLLARLAEVDVLNLAGKRGERHLGKQHDVELAEVPVPTGPEEAPPLVGHARRSHRLQRGDEDDLVAATETGLKLPHPGTAAREVDLVEEELARPAGRLEAPLQVLLENPDP